MFDEPLLLECVAFRNKTNTDCCFFIAGMDILKAEIVRKRKLIEEKQLVDVSVLIYLATSVG